MDENIQYEKNNENDQKNKQVESPIEYMNGYSMHLKQINSQNCLMYTTNTSLKIIIPINDSQKDTVHLKTFNILDTNQIINLIQQNSNFQKNSIEQSSKANLMYQDPLKQKKLIHDLQFISCHPLQKMKDFEMVAVLMRARAYSSSDIQNAMHPKNKKSSCNNQQRFKQEGKQGYSLILLLYQIENPNFQIFSFGLQSIKNGGFLKSYDFQDQTIQEADILKALGMGNEQLGILGSIKCIQQGQNSMIMISGDDGKVYIYQIITKKKVQFNQLDQSESSADPNEFAKIEPNCDYSLQLIHILRVTDLQNISKFETFKGFKIEQNQNEDENSVIFIPGTYFFEFEILNYKIDNLQDQYFYLIVCEHVMGFLKVFKVFKNQENDQWNSQLQERFQMYQGIITSFQVNKYIQNQEVSITSFKRKKSKFFSEINQGNKLEKICQNKRCKSLTKFEQQEDNFFDDILYSKYNYDIDIFRNEIINQNEEKVLPHQQLTLKIKTPTFLNSKTKESISIIDNQLNQEIMFDISNKDYLNIFTQPITVGMKKGFVKSNNIYICILAINNILVVGKQKEKMEWSKKYDYLIIDVIPDCENQLLWIGLANGSIQTLFYKDIYILNCKKNLNFSQFQESLSYL